MVWRRDRDGIDALVRKRLANIAIQLGLFSLGFLDDFRPSLQHFRIDIAESHIFGFILHFKDVSDVCSPLPVEADGANANPRIHIAPRGKTHTWRGNNSSSTGRQKGSSCESHKPVYPLR